MKKKLEVIQEENSDCGICSLASIIKYYKGDISLETLRFMTNTTNNGCNALELINCAKILGFNAYGEKCEIIKNINQPLIAHLKLENNLFHFVVIYKIDKKFITIMDPSRGFVKMKKEQFYKLFTGIIIHLIQINSIPKYKKSKFIQKSITKEIINNKKSYIIILIISILILLLTIINNFEVKLLNYNYNIIYLLLFVLFFNEILIYTKNVLILNNTIKFNNKIIKDFVIHIFKLPLNYLKLKQKGEISTRFSELNELTNNILNVYIEIIFCIFLCLNSILLIIFYSSVIFLIILLVSLIYIIFNIYVYKLLLNEIKYLINLEENYNSNILDYISNFDTIKHLNIYNFFINNINDNLFKKNNITKSLNKKFLIISLVNNIIIGFILLIVLYFLIIYSYDTTNALLIYMLLNFYINNLKNLINYYPTILILKAYIQKSNDFLSFKEYSNDLNINKFQFIKIKKLYYRINNVEILKNIRYEIKNNDKVFIKGPSGVGKSTLMKILNNELTNYTGEVLIDNNDIKKYNLKDLITYVSQNETIFNDSIYNNLTLGLKVDERKLNKVLKICRIDSISIMNLSGINSLIVNDNSLSGGEKNRLILARSLLHGKEIIILDEVLKEVDINLEIVIISDILKYYKDKTILYISHKNVEFLFEKVLTFRKE